MVSDDFAEVSKIVEAGVTSKPTRDYELSRYACYLVVQNGDPRKEVIALGQTYFAIQTYRQEVADHFNELDEDNRRLVVRGDIKQWNQMLAETAHNAGVITNEEFAFFQNAGYMGLYGGLDVDDIHSRKQLEVGQKILDYMGSTELIANLFRISQTEEKLRKDKIQGADKATSVHYNVGKEVRTAIEKIGGIMHGMVVAGHTPTTNEEEFAYNDGRVFSKYDEERDFLFYDIDCGCWMRYIGKNNARLACIRLEDEKVFYV